MNNEGRRNIEYLQIYLLTEGPKFPVPTEMWHPCAYNSALTSKDVQGSLAFFP